jgi:hypothetical protein
VAGGAFRAAALLGAFVTRASMWIAVFALASLPATVIAQTSAPLPPAPRLGKVSGSALRTGKVDLCVLVTQNGRSESLGSRTLTISPSAYQGTGAWLIIEAWDAGALSAADSLYVARADMTPLHRAVHMGVLHIENDFSSDSVTGKVSLPQGAVPMGLANRPGLMVNGNMLEVILQLVPLRRGWTGTADMLVVGPQGAGTIQVRLEVTGEEGNGSRRYVRQLARRGER